MGIAVSRREGRQAFTLIELLVVVAIIMILMGLLFPVYNMVRVTAKKTRAKAEVKQLDMAWKSVLSDYRTWVLSGVGEQRAGVEMDAARVQYLGGSNSKGIMYMEFDGGATNAAGGMVDPWYHATKNPSQVYKVALGQTDVNPPHGLIYRSVAVWSKGPDGKDTSAADQKDDIKSWE